MYRCDLRPALTTYFQVVTLTRQTVLTHAGRVEEAARRESDHFDDDNRSVVKNPIIVVTLAEKYPEPKCP